MKRGELFRIGLTGGIASGKSTVSSMLRRMGAVVIDTDKIAHELTQPGAEALSIIRRHFGPGILDQDGTLRRSEVGRIIFSDPEEKRWLESLLHPLIRARAEEQALAAYKAGHCVVVFDVPLLFETGWNEWVDEIWTVYATQELQKKRLQERDGFTAQEIEERLASQWPIGEKAKCADVVIDNTGSLEDTSQQVETAWRTVLKKVQE